MIRIGRVLTPRLALQPLAAFAAGLLVVTAVQAQAPKSIGAFSDWRVFSHGEGNTLLCFAAARPSKQEPAGAKRDPAYFYVSAWPTDGVKTEVSVRLGYPLRKGSEVALTIGTAAFKLFINGDRAYVADATQELKLIDAMKKGSTMMVKGVSERGTATTDTYSLNGITQAVQTLTTSCK